MATALKLRRGTTTQHSTFTGAEGEVTIDTTKDTAVVHDGSTAGGFPLMRESGTSSTGVWSLGTNHIYKDASGNVGIGTSSPSYRFQVSDGSADTRGMFLSNNNFSIGVGRSTSAIGGYIGSPSSDVMVFSGNGGAEKMRIDSSGNVLVGKNTSSDNTAGTLIAPTYLFVTRDGFAPLNLRRLTSSGNIAEFYSGTSGTSSGAISVASTGMTYTGTNGITFTATQTASADANTLDDYEEGTFTPSMTFGGNAAFSSVTANGKYTKVGNVVTFEIQFGGYTKTANTGNAQITGLPFSFSDLQKIYIAQGDDLTYTSGAYLFCYNNGSGTDLNPYQQSAGIASNLTNSAFGNSGTFRVCGSYFTS